MIFSSFLIGYVLGQGNQHEVYGDTGNPKNCRALIAKNIEGFDSEDYTAEEALYSIDRNCGRNGIIWLER